MFPVLDVRHLSADHRESSSTKFHLEGSNFDQVRDHNAHGIVVETMKRDGYLQIINVMKYCTKFNG